MLMVIELYVKGFFNVFQTHSDDQKQPLTDDLQDNENKGVGNPSFLHSEKRSSKGPDEYF